MDELRHRLERLTREGTATAVAPEVSHIRGRAHRLRRRRVTSAVLAVALLSGLVLGSGRAFTSWIENANPTGPLQRGTPTTTDNRDALDNNPFVKLQGRPIAPVVVVAQGTFEGRAWRYLAFRTDRGKVCGQWYEPDAVRQAPPPPGWVVNVGGYQLAIGGGCDFTFGTSGFKDGNRTATNFDASLPARYASVRIVLDGRPPMVLYPAGRKELGRGFIAIRLPDLRSVREMVAYDDRGRVIYHGKANRNLVRGLDFTPVQP
jgi:hypothetical protein